MKKFLKEFREFALKSNVLDLAIAVIMGAAAGKMVTSLVESILMPIIGIILGGISFSTLSVDIGDASILYGAFIQSVIDFLIISVCVFFMMKAIKGLEKKALHKEEKSKEKEPTSEDYLKEIRDLLKEQGRS